MRTASKYSHASPDIMCNHGLYGEQLLTAGLLDGDPKVDVDSRARYYRLWWRTGKVGTSAGVVGEVHGSASMEERRDIRTATCNTALKDATI